MEVVSGRGGHEEYGEGRGIGLLSGVTTLLLLQVFLIIMYYGIIII